MPGESVLEMFLRDIIQRAKKQAKTTGAIGQFDVLSSYANHPSFAQRSSTVKIEHFQAII